MPPEGLEALCGAQKLAVLGGFHPEPLDGAPKGCKSLLLIGPGAGFWAHFEGSPEFGDGASDPLDRWSERVLGGIAYSVGARALFPFGGPPFAPFIAWALRSGQCFTSPVGLLVHARHGLMVSFRGALAFDVDVPLLDAAANPCETCAGQPCRSACPAEVLSPNGYDVPGCQRFLGTQDGAACKAGGCQVRRACPLDGAKREQAQSGFHMRAFRGE